MAIEHAIYRPMVTENTGDPPVAVPLTAEERRAAFQALRVLRSLLEKTP